MPVKSAKDVLVVLKTAERMGLSTDEPEGMRYITISDTLVKEMIEALEGVNYAIHGR